MNSFIGLSKNVVAIQIHYSLHVIHQCNSNSNNRMASVCIYLPSRSVSEIKLIQWAGGAGTGI